MPDERLKYRLYMEVDRQFKDDLLLLLAAARRYRTFMQQQGETGPEMQLLTRTIERLKKRAWRIPDKDEPPTGV